jgi:hypothetical protein
VSGIQLFSFPWPGPGNSETAQDSEGWLDAEDADEAPGLHASSETPLLVSFPWPGPGDREA